MKKRITRPTTRLPSARVDEAGASAATAGGLPADVQYAGGAACLVSGVVEAGLTIPARAFAGTQAPILIPVGRVTSQPGVMIAVP
jgi:uncharacterized protein (TIGR03437 family)